MQNCNSNKWLKIESYSLVLLYSICIVSIIGKSHLWLLAISSLFFVLNILFNLFIIKNEVSSKPFLVIKILTDFISSILIIHLTGGLSSQFIWILLLPIISIYALFYTKDNLLPAVFAVLSLFFYVLIIFFTGALSSPLTAKNILSFLSYSTLFFIFNWLILKQNIFEDNFGHIEKSIPIGKAELGEPVKKEPEAKDDLMEYKEVVRVAANLSDIDHDINNPLTIISLTISRIQLIAQKYNDEKLVKYSNQMSEALAKVSTILLRVKEIKKLDLIKNQKRINDEEKNSDS